MSASAKLTHVLVGGIKLSQIHAVSIEKDTSALGHGQPLPSAGIDFDSIN